VLRKEQRLERILLIIYLDLYSQKIVLQQTNYLCHVCHLLVVPDPLVEFFHWSLCLQLLYHCCHLQHVQIVIFM
jgi:hypothetical protein